MESALQRLTVNNVVVCLSLKKITENPSQLLSKVIEENLNKDNIQVKKKLNFTVLKKNNFNFVIFNKSGHVNIIGSSNFSEIDLSLKVFNDIFKSDYTFQSDCRVVNSTWSTTFKVDGKINLYKFPDYFKGKNNYYRVFLRPTFFPGAVLRHTSLPTIIFFSNGRINIVGAKNQHEAESGLINFLSHLLSILKKEEDVQVFTRHYTSNIRLPPNHQ